MIGLSFSFPHHGTYSSYHRLLHYLGEDDETVDASTPTWMHQKLINPRGWTQIAWRSIKERQACALARNGRHQWLHYLYPEHGYFKGKTLRPAGLKIAMSCHLPTEMIEESGDQFKVLKEGLSIADALIVMSPDDLDCYSRLAPNAKVSFIPHGIDIHHFKPPAQERAPRRDHATILTCGGMLRDFETLAQVIEIAASRKVPWKFQVITSKGLLEKLRLQLSEAARRNFEPLCGISDSELVERYQRADLLYLPLLNATANNTVLEAMACGLPMLLSDFTATRAYAAETADYIKGRSAEEAFARIEEIISNSEILQKKALQVRNRAVKHLAWEVILDQQKKFLNDNKAPSHSGL
jgi:glycosyltransferase involved in cell wall biosynthesis